MLIQISQCQSLQEVSSMQLERLNHTEDYFIPSIRKFLTEIKPANAFEIQGPKAFLAVSSSI